MTSRVADTEPHLRGTPYIQSISRAAFVLRLIGNLPETGAAFSDIQRLSMLPRATVHRLLKSLKNEGFVLQDAKTRRYQVGPLIYELGLVARSPAPNLDECQDIIDAASVTAGTCVSVLFRSGDDVLCIRRSAWSQKETTPGDVGIRRPIGVGAGGIAILAMQKEEEREAIIQRQSDLYKSYGALETDTVRRAVELTLSRGFAVRPFGILHRGVGVAVPTKTSPVSLAVRSGPVSINLPRSEIRRIASQLTEAAAKVAEVVDSGSQMKTERRLH